jgi:hypothetical protein
LPGIGRKVDVDGGGLHLASHANIGRKGGESLWVADRRGAHVSLLAAQSIVLIVLAHIRHLLWRNARGHGRAVRWAPALVHVVRIRDGEAAQPGAHAVVEPVLWPLHGGMSVFGMRVVEVVLGNQVGRVLSRGDVRVLRGRAAVPLELRGRPIDLVSQESGFRAKRGVPRVLVGRRRSELMLVEGWRLVCGTRLVRVGLEVVRRRRGVMYLRRGHVVDIWGSRRSAATKEGTVVLVSLGGRREEREVSASVEVGSEQVLIEAGLGLGREGRVVGRCVSQALSRIEELIRSGGGVVVVEVGGCVLRLLLDVCRGGVVEAKSETDSGIG